jgi:hypothetical protein
VATGDGTSIFRGLERISYIDTTSDPTLTSDDHNAVAMSQYGYLIGTANEAAIDIDAIGVREAVMSGKDLSKETKTSFTGYTSNATATDVGKMLISEGNNVFLRAFIVARESVDIPTVYGSYMVEAQVYRNTNGNVTLANSTTTTINETDVGMFAEIAVDTTAQTADISVTGVAATNIEWQVNVEITRVGPRHVEAI